MNNVAVERPSLPTPNSQLRAGILFRATSRESRLWLIWRRPGHSRQLTWNASWSIQQQPQNATGLFCGNAQRCPSQLFFQCFPWSHWAGCLGNDHEHELQNFCLWLLRCRYTTKQGTIVTAPPQPQPRVHSGRLIPIFGAPNFLCLTSRIP